MAVGLQQIANQLAFVIGGTLSSTTNFYSGHQAGDTTGLQPPGATFFGCWSTTPENLNDLPVGIVVPFRGTSNVPTGGIEQAEDILHLLILLSRNDAPTQTANAAWYVDGVRDLLSGHMQLKDSTGAPLVDSGWVQWPEYEFGNIPWPENHLGYRWTIRIPRVITRNFVA